MAETVSRDSEERLAIDLEQFAFFDRKGGWALAYLVARRVQPDLGTGVSIEQQSKWCAPTTWHRISARQFAKRTGTSHKRVMAYLRAWERAAADGHVPAAAALDHDTEVHLPDEEQVPFFGEGGYYHSQEASEISTERLARIEQEAQLAGIRPQASAYVASHPKAMTAAIIADERAYQVAKAALAERERRWQDRGNTRDDATESTEGGAADQEIDSVRGTGPEPAALVLQELTAARLGVIRALALLKKHPVNFTPDRGVALTQLCDSARVALESIKDLALSSSSGLSDAALQAFLEESENL